MIGGVVVTYNRKKELLKNIQSILGQEFKLDKYYIVDNHGTDNTYDFLCENSVFDDSFMKYIYLDNNIGGAGGFYTGIKKAYEDGCDFIYLMDDDGRPINPESLKILVNKSKEFYAENKMIFSNSLVLADEYRPNDLSFNLGGILKREDVIKNALNGSIGGFANPFNGTLISKELIDKIGFPNIDFFIRGDEIDYMSRAKEAGATIVTIVDSIYYHPKSDVKTFSLFGKKYIATSINSPWKMYYYTRNRVYTLQRDAGAKRTISFILLLLYSLLRWEPQKIASLKMMFKGINDAFAGKLGKRVEPRV